MESEKMKCDRYVKSTITEEDGTCWGCDNYWNNGCPYGRQADKKDWKDLEAIKREEKDKAVKQK